MMLSDIRMPGMNGYEFVKKTKEIEWLKLLLPIKTKVMLLTLHPHQL
jgi:CheY-like chemotaxis protein